MKNIDNLHFKWQRPLSYNKTWNFVIGERCSGKSTDGWLRIWKAYHYDNRPSIILRRQIVDITAAYIDSIQEVLNKFLDEPVQVLYIKSSVKEGTVDVKLGEYGVDYSWQAVQKLPIFCRIIALSNPMSRIKSLVVRNIKYIFFDEFICNTRCNEKYLKDEFFMIQEIYTTYVREVELADLRILAAGNPYSVYCPLFSGLGVNTALLKPGAFVVGDDYVIDCFRIPDELREAILAVNPMLLDDVYARYAFGGEAINDANIRIEKSEPRGSKLKWVFRIGRDILTIHKKADEGWWCCKHKEDWIEKVSKRRKLYVFNFADMCDGSYKVDSTYLQMFLSFKMAMNKRAVTFNCIDASYMAEDIYSMV